MYHSMTCIYTLLNSLLYVSAYSYGSGTCVASDHNIVYNAYTNPSGMQNVISYSGTVQNNGWQWINTNTNTGYINGDIPLQYTNGIINTYALVNTLSYNWTGILVYGQDALTGVRIGSFTSTIDMHTIPTCDSYINNTMRSGQINTYYAVNTTLTHSHADPLNPFPSGYDKFQLFIPSNYTSNITFYIAIMNGARDVVTFQVNASYLNTSNYNTTTLVSAGSQIKTQSSSALSASLSIIHTLTIAILISANIIIN